MSSVTCLSSVFLKFFKNKTIPGQPLSVYGNGFQKLSHASSFESPNISVEGVISFVSLRFYFPLISNIGYCQNPQYLQGFVGSAHTRPPE